MNCGRFFTILALSCLSFQGVRSEVILPDVLSSGMVVQRDKAVCLWGTAEAGEKICASCGGDSVVVYAGDTGKWRLELPALSAGGPYSINVNGKIIDNVLAGDVFLCSGQSNMELPIRRVADMFADEVAKYSNDDIRLFQVEKVFDFTGESTNAKGDWKMLSPETASGYSALCYFFAKELNARTGIPVGIVNSSWGGTPIEAWMSRESLSDYPLAINKWKFYADAGYRERIKELEGESFRRWNDVLNDSDPGISSSQRWSDVGLDDSSWKTVSVPGEYGVSSASWGSDGLNPVNGSHWFRKTVEIPASMAGKNAVVRLGCIVDADSVFFNGVFIGTTSYQYPPRKYTVPGNLVKAGKNQITVRLISQNGYPAFVADKPYRIESSGDTVSLEGEWRYRQGARMPVAPGMEFYCYVPTVLYNSMISPLRNMPFSGVVWYQGESNVGSRNQYSSLLKTMIADWRKRWNNKKMPFYIVELAGFLHPSETTERKAWQEMRDSQADAVAGSHDTWLIKNCDLGEWNDIHPLDKKTLGVRVADAVISASEESRVRSDESFMIIPGKNPEVKASTPVGKRYGESHLKRLRAMGVTIEDTIISSPAFTLRILDHWDNLDGTVERGYAGKSLWKWDELPDSVSSRCKDYAELCAAVGINGTVLNNVNASSQILSDEYLKKVAALADLFRSYGIKVYLSANFAAPMQLGGLESADPLDAGVKEWWNDKVREIYAYIPDFGGFLVKANSEGQPGPCDFGRTHAEGANMLARVLKPYGGIVMWRAFVYSPDDADRAKQAYIEFKPLDGKFDDNVIVQIKNGPVDFQPREPFSPLLSAMPHTRTMPELQITQEYLGHSNHLAYLAPMWTELFSAVSPEGQAGIAGVANIGDSRNFTGHPFARANWYAFGRLAWDPGLSPEQIAREWVALELKPRTKETEDRIVDIMLRSREAVVDYMMPMGLHHLFAFGHHYGPEPWCDPEGARPDWLPKYYHQADSIGIGFDRSLSGSGAVSQYPYPYSDIYGSVDKCPEEYLLWFHHVEWSKILSSGETLWESLCRHYERGVKEAKSFVEEWKKCEKDIPDKKLYADVARRLEIQAKDAVWWKDACLLYFQDINGLDFLDFVSPAVHTLEGLKSVSIPIDNFTCPSGELLDEIR